MAIESITSWPRSAKQTLDLAVITTACPALELGSAAARSCGEGQRKEEHFPPLLPVNSLDFIDWNRGKYNYVDTLGPTKPGVTQFGPSSDRPRRFFRGWSYFGCAKLRQSQQQVSSNDPYGTLIDQLAESTQIFHPPKFNAPRGLALLVCRLLARDPRAQNSLLPPRIHHYS